MTFQNLFNLLFQFRILHICIEFNIQHFKAEIHGVIRRKCIFSGG